MDENSVPEEFGPFIDTGAIRRNFEDIRENLRRSWLEVERAESSLQRFLNGDGWFFANSALFDLARVREAMRDADIRTTRVEDIVAPQCRHRLGDYPRLEPELWGSGAYRFKRTAGKKR